MRSIFVTVVAALAVIGATSAQQQPPTFKTNTSVVQVDVRVFKGNQFVTGLGPDDFVVTEDGVPQKVQSVVLIDGSQLPASSSQLPAASSQVPASSSRVQNSSGTAAVWLFVFDTPHLSPAGLTHTRDAVLQFMDTKWHQGDIGGVVYDGKMANNRLTSDRAELRAAVTNIKTPGNQRNLQIEITREWPRFQDEYEILRVAVDNDRDTIAAVVARACNDDPDACKRASPDAEAIGKAHRIASEIQQSTLGTLQSVVALSNGLARLPGPKTVVFLSEGFVAEKMETQIRDAVGDAARAGAHFYTIDARGLDRGSASSSIIDQPQETSFIGRTAHFDALADAPNSLAVDTGGFAIRNENDFGKALDEIQRDAGEYYVIGYSPTNSTFDGKYRAINVEVKQPGLKVRARRGYLALAPALLLKPTSIVGANGLAAPKRPEGAEAGAAAAVPDVTVLSGAGSLEAMTGTIAAVPVLPGGERTAGSKAVRARVESGVLSLKKFDAKNQVQGNAERGWAAYERGDVATAAAELSAVATTDTRPWVSFALGYAQFALQRYSDATDAWMRVKKAVPQFEPVYFNLADALSLQGKESGAIDILREAEKAWPSDPEVQDAIGVIQVRRSAIDAAIKSFERAIQLAPADPVGYFNLGRAYQMRFNQTQRYDAPTERWIGNQDDRNKSIAAYQKYVDLHGPYEQQAKEAIAQLQWGK